MTVAVPPGGSDTSAHTTGDPSEQLPCDDAGRPQRRCSRARSCDTPAASASSGPALVTVEVTVTSPSAAMDAGAAVAETPTSAPNSATENTELVAAIRPGAGGLQLLGARPPRGEPSEGRDPAHRRDRHRGAAADGRKRDRHGRIAHRSATASRTTTVTGGSIAAPAAGAVGSWPKARWSAPRCGEQCACDLLSGGVQRPVDC